MARNQSPQQFDSGLDPSNPTEPSNGEGVARGVYTQAEIAERLGGISVTTVKKYLKRLKDIYIWMGEAEWTNAKGRYPEKVLEYLLDYQTNCGAMRVEDGLLIENTDAVGFQDYKAHIWQRYEYVEKIAANEPIVPVFDGELLEPGALTISKQHGLSTLADNREISADALAGTTKNVQDMEILADQIGTQLGKNFAGRVNAAKQKAFLEESTKGDQALLNSLQPKQD